jgi:hypothetical protein
MRDARSCGDAAAL